MGIRVFNFLIDFEKANNRHKQTTGGWGFGIVRTRPENFDLARHSTYKKFFSFQNTTNNNYEKKKKLSPFLLSNKKYHIPISNPITTLSALLFDFTQKFLYIVFEK